VNFNSYAFDLTEHNKENDNKKNKNNLFQTTLYLLKLIN